MNDARQNAVATWTHIPCGGEGDFIEIEARRWALYPWLRRFLWNLSYLAAGKSVLEIGPGQGTDLAMFAATGAVCHAVDITQRHLDATHSNFAQRGWKVRTELRDAVDIKGEYDLIYMNGVLHHIPEDEEVVRAVYRCLKPGGRFVFLVYNKYSWFHLSKLLIGLFGEDFSRPRIGDMWRMGYYSFLSTLEAGADGISRKPYIKLYSKRDIRHLLKGWKWESWTECKSPLPDWVPFGGWFHVVQARKQ